MMNVEDLSNDELDYYITRLKTMLREKPTAHQRQLKSGKLVPVKGRAPQPQNIEPRVSLPPPETLARMSIEQLQHLMKLAQRMSTGNKSEVIKGLYAAIRAKMQTPLAPAPREPSVGQSQPRPTPEAPPQEPEPAEPDEFGNTPEDVEEWSRIVDEIESCTPQIIDTGQVISGQGGHNVYAPLKLKWNDCGKDFLTPTVQKGFDRAVRKLKELRGNIKILKRLLIFSKYKGKFYLSQKGGNSGLASDPAAKKIWGYRPLSRTVAGFYNHRYGCIVIRGSQGDSKWIAECILHEMGHDLWYNSLPIGRKDKVKEAFKEAKKQMEHDQNWGMSFVAARTKWFGRGYALTNEEEFFAEVFAWYVGYGEQRFASKYPQYVDLMKQVLK